RKQLDRHSFTSEDPVPRPTQGPVRRTVLRGRTSASSRLSGATAGRKRQHSTKSTRKRCWPLAIHPAPEGFSEWSLSLSGTTPSDPSCWRRLLRNGLVPAQLDPIARLRTLPPGPFLSLFPVPTSSFVPRREFRHQNQSTVSIWAPGQNSAEAMRRRLPVTRVSLTGLGRSMRF
ncbi:MAG: hypothetical protein RIS24_3454, partial [Verrucomicrobiota bacterium]